MLHRLGPLEFRGTVPSFAAFWKARLNSRSPPVAPPASRRYLKGKINHELCILFSEVRRRSFVMATENEQATNICDRGGFVS
jgi:hypothetical protein